MNEEDLKFYNMQDKEKLVWMCISRDNRIKSLQQRIDKAVEVLKLCNSKCSKEVIKNIKRW